MSNYKNNGKSGMNLKEALTEITWIMEVWGHKMGRLNDKEMEALKVITAHCKPYIGIINAMQGRKCFNATQKMERGNE